MKRRRRGARGAAAAALALTMVTACSSAPAGESSTTAGAASTESITSGLQAPWSVAFHGGTPLVSERDSARILELDAEGNARGVGSIGGAAGGGEGGLLGIAVQDGFLYSYATAGEENRIERRELTGSTGSLGLGPPRGHPGWDSGRAHPQRRAHRVRSGRVALCHHRRRRKPRQRPGHHLAVRKDPADDR